MSDILVTGAAGFIGFHVCKALLERGDKVIGIDNLNDYYDPRLKEARLSELAGYKLFSFQKLDVADRAGMEKLFEKSEFSRVVHLAAQAGVRYSVQNPQVYVESNVVGFLHILEGCRHHKISHLVFASSSSVYGSNTKVPFSTEDFTDHPLSLYAATKKSNELMAYSYSHLYQIPTTGLRFFTVYGPWGRPDMATFLFTKAITEDRPINVFNFGKMQRDFTYVDDIAQGVLSVLDRPPVSTIEAPDTKDGQESLITSKLPAPPYKVYNIGNHQPVELDYFITLLEKLLNKKAIRNNLPLQQGDVLSTYADIDDLTHDTGFVPVTPIDKGLASFVAWYKSYYG